MSSSIFKHMLAFRLPTPWNVTAEALSEQLQRYSFTPCGSQEALSRGFVPPRGGEDEPLVHSVGGQFLITLHEQKRMLPSSVVNEAAVVRAKELSARDGRIIGRKQMKAIKEEVYLELLPKAFLKNSQTQAWVNPTAGWLVVNAGSSAKADTMLEMLCKAIETFPAKRLNTVLTPEAAMADWLTSGDAPAGFTVDRDCELKSPAEEKAAVRYVRHSLEGDDVRQHLAQGKRPTRLAMTYNDRVSLVLTAKQELKSIKLLDVVMEAAAAEAEDAENIFDAEFTLMTGEYTLLLGAVVGALGGEAQE